MARAARRCAQSTRTSTSSSVSSALTGWLTVSQVRPPRRASDSSGTTSRPADTRSTRASRPRRGRREAADADDAGAGGAAGRVGQDPRGQLPPASAELREAPVARRRAALHRTPERGERRAVAIGLLEAEPRFAGPAGAEHDLARVNLVRELLRHAHELAESPPRAGRRNAAATRLESRAEVFASSAISGGPEMPRSGASWASPP